MWGGKEGEKLERHERKRRGKEGEEIESHKEMKKKENKKES